MAWKERKVVTVRARLWTAERLIAKGRLAEAGEQLVAAAETLWPQAGAA